MRFRRTLALPATLGALLSLPLLRAVDAAAPPAPAHAPAAAASGPAARGAGAGRAGAPGRRAYPPTRKAEVRETLHGVDIVDPYRWLEDGDAAEVKAWMKTEDDEARAALGKLPGRAAIAARLKELAYVETMGVPQHRGTRWFFTRRLAEQEKSVVMWKEGKDGVEKVLLDPNAWTKDGSDSLGGHWVSWDGKTVAYTVKRNNSDESTLYVMDVATGVRSGVDVIEGAKYASADWTPAGDGFYYTYLPPLGGAVTVAERPGWADVRFHKLGTDPRNDPVIHDKTGDPRTFAGVGLSRDGRWLLYSRVNGTRSVDVWFRDLGGKGGGKSSGKGGGRKAGRKSAPAAGTSPGEWTPLAVGKDAVYTVEAWQDVFYVLTNEGAPKSHLYRVDAAHPARERWQEIVAERPDATLTGFAIVGNRLTLSWLKDVASVIEVRELDGKPVRQLTLPTVGSASPLIGNEDEDTAYYTFTSFTTPTEIYETSVKTGESRLWYRLKVPVDPSRYQVEQVFVTSKDGTRVPLFIVRGRDARKDGNAPTLLTGYGGFRVAQRPSFRGSIYPWLERGGVFAVVSLRGGNEYGEEWHQAGMRHKKQNVFDDFIAAAEYLIKQGLTRPARLAIQGGSNGGLLVGAAMTQRPDLFRAVLCGVPLLDMLRFHLYGSGKTWIEEYGSAEVAEDFQVLRAYSPYHHVQAGTAYPALLMDSADSDDRVDPMHARKFVALMQERSTGGPVLLRIERNAGHGGADLVRAGVERTADQLAFALDSMGVAAP